MVAVKSYTSCCYVILPCGPRPSSTQANCPILLVISLVSWWHVDAPEILKVCLHYTLTQTHTHQRRKVFHTLKIIDAVLIFTHERVKSSITVGYLKLSDCSEGVRGQVQMAVRSERFQPSTEIIFRQMCVN